MHNTDSTWVSGRSTWSPPEGRCGPDEYLLTTGGSDTMCCRIVGLSFATPRRNEQQYMVFVIQEDLKQTREESMDQTQTL